MRDYGSVSFLAAAEKRKILSFVEIRTQFSKRL